MKDNFILYTQQYEVLEPLTDEQLGKLLRALYLYARDKEIPVFDDGMLTMAFGFVRMQIDASNAKYEEKRARLRQNGMKGGRPKKNQEETEKPNGFENNQEKPNGFENNQYSNDSNVKSSNDRVDRVKEEPSKDASKSKNVVFDASLGEPQKSSSLKSKKKEIDFKAIKDYWNERHDATHSAMRRLTIMSDQRKNNVRARLREYGGDVAQIYKAIDTAMQSDFMNGKNGKGWIASFDWIMCPTNFPKVLEGNYTDEHPASAPHQQGTPQPQAEQSIGERWEAIKLRGEQKRQEAKEREGGEDNDQRYVWVINSNLEDLRKNPNNKPARQSLLRFYEAGVLQRLGIKWKP